MRRLALATILLAACGDDGAVRHLDGGVDSMADATPDAPPLPVTITVTVDGSPHEGVQVYFQATDSTVLSSPKTGADGKATGMLPHGGYVTAIEPFATTPPAVAPNKVVRSFAGVKPGDELHLDGGSHPVVMMTVSAPTDAAANLYQLSTPCGSTTTDSPQTATLYLTDCGATTDLLVLARDQSSRILHYIYAPNLTVSAGGTLDVSAMTYVDPTTRTYQVNNVPSGLQTVQVTDTPATANGLFVPTQVDATGTPRTASQPVVAFTGETSIVEISAENGFTRQTLVDWGPVAPLVTDWSGRALAPFTAALQWDQASHSAIWSEGTGMQPDLTYVTARSFRANENLVWEIVAPHTVGTVVFPTLPADSAGYNFDTSDSVELDMRVAKVPGGYDAVRPYAFSRGLVPMLSATGSASVEEFAPLARSRRL